MNCIIVDDEPLAREAVETLVKEVKELHLIGSFNNALSASIFMQTNPVQLIFLDIQMPNITGLEFARTIPKNTLVIFTTAYAQFALDSYEVDAVDYLVKPIEQNRFCRAVEKAFSYYSMLNIKQKDNIEDFNEEFIFVKSERRYFKVKLTDILYIEGLKDYVIIHLETERIITKMNLKNIHEKLPKFLFLRVNKSFIVNIEHIQSFDNNDIFIKTHIVPIGNSYRETFFNEFVLKRL